VHLGIIHINQAVRNRDGAIWSRIDFRDGCLLMNSEIHINKAGSLVDECGFGYMHLIT